MSSDPVLIDDDDVNMDSVVILDEEEDKISNKKSAPVPTIETIDLDDETPIITKGTVINTIAKKNKKYKKKSLNKSEKDFVNNLKNNRLMDKIVTKCINMENSVGMPRVIYKTLLPLYRDTNNTFKESKSFRSLLKNTYKMLVRDPDHKFLHIKTLCEELKSGGLRRKVPFVTLATNLKENGSQWENEELTSSSREINRNVEENRLAPQVHTNDNSRRERGGTDWSQIKKKTNNNCATVNKTHKMKTRKSTHLENDKTDIIDLDNSESESVDLEKSENDNCRNDVIIIEETESSEQRNDETDEILEDVANNTLQKQREDVNKIHSEKTGETNKTLQEVLEETDKILEKIMEKDSNKENNNSETSEVSDDKMDYELLIPQNHVDVTAIETEVQNTLSAEALEQIAKMEKEIAFYKEVIDKLEQQEVTTENCNASPYFVCSKYKEKVVELYKKICEINGGCADIVKRREIRLVVNEGHPAGPAKILERFLNDNIDSTGTVPFPDFSDVVGCVVRANVEYKLDWSRQQIFQEAATLFQLCGQALRKRRQMREYRDLLSLVREKEHDDDPAEKDPVLLAKLENNKLIARRKEDQLLDRYVNMENNMSRIGSATSGVCQDSNTVEFESDNDSNDTDSENEDDNVSLPTNIITAINFNQPETSDPSASNNTNNNLNALSSSEMVSDSTSKHIETLINRAILGLTERNKQSKVGVPCNINNYNSVIRHTMNAVPSAKNPLLANLLAAPMRPPSHMIQKTNDNSCAILDEEEEISPNVGFFSYDHSDSQPGTNLIDTNHNEKEKANDGTFNMNGVNIKMEDGDDGKNCDASTKPDIKVKVEDNTLDVQSMLDELGDDFECKVYDIEDPFLVIEISSDGFTDDEDL